MFHILFQFVEIWRLIRLNSNEIFKIVYSLDCQLDDIVRRPNREHAEKVHEVKTGFYGSMDNNGDVITCLNITFEINRHSKY